MADRPRLPGAIGASHLRVYDTTAPDGLAGGTPHLHTVCTEAYFVIAGRGRVQTLTTSGFDETPLDPGAMVWFTPGTIHRLVNEGDLEILVLMQNDGLPEAGDMVITLSADVVRDPDAYDSVAVLPEDERTTTGSRDAARRRRDAAVEAFGSLVAATTAGDLSPLESFHAAAATLVRDRVARWRPLWEAGPLQEATRTGVLMDGLANGSASHFGEASVHRLDPAGDVRRMGCCGTLGTYVP
jgi:mannose-6-phosphate isomerase-like protein (cupin superfamily)